MESAKKVLIWEKKVDHYKTSSFLSHIKNELNVTMFGDIEIKKKNKFHYSKYLINIASVDIDKRNSIWQVFFV